MFTCTTVAVVLQSVAGWLDGRGIMLTNSSYSCCGPRHPDVTDVPLDVVVDVVQLELSLVL